jgi:hypothetical protein
MHGRQGCQASVGQYFGARLGQTSLAEARLDKPGNSRNWAIRFGDACVVHVAKDWRNCPLSAATPVDQSERLFAPPIVANLPLVFLCTGVCPPIAKRVSYHFGKFVPGDAGESVKIGLTHGIGLIFDEGIDKRLLIRRYERVMESWFLLMDICDAGARIDENDHNRGSGAAKSRGLPVHGRQS